jgi:hypothetical protein
MSYSAQDSLQYEKRYIQHMVLYQYVKRHIQHMTVYILTVNVTGLEGPEDPVLNKALCSVVTSTSFLSGTFPLLTPGLLNLQCKKTVNYFLHKETKTNIV